MRLTIGRDDYVICAAGSTVTAVGPGLHLALPADSMALLAAALKEKADAVGATANDTVVTLVCDQITYPTAPTGRKRGRPKGSKNKARSHVRR